MRDCVLMAQVVVTVEKIPEQDPTSSFGPKSKPEFTSKSTNVKCFNEFFAEPPSTAPSASSLR